MCFIATFSTMTSYQFALADMILYNLHYTHAIIGHGALSTMTVWNYLELLWFNSSSRLDTRLLATFFFSVFLVRPAGRPKLGNFTSLDQFHKLLNSTLSTMDYSSMGLSPFQECESLDKLTH